MEVTNIHGATVSWTTDVTRTGFTGCVRANFHADLRPPTSAKPFLDFFAFQINLKWRTGGLLDGGMASLPVFTSASVCSDQLSVKVSISICLLTNFSKFFKDDTIMI